MNKLWHGFVDEKAMITTTLVFSSHWKTLAPFCSWKKRPENTLTLTVNFCKDIQKNILSHPINWLFNDMWCYLVIAFFRLKNWHFSANIAEGFIISLTLKKKTMIGALCIWTNMVYAIGCLAFVIHIGTKPHTRIVW